MSRKRAGVVRTPRYWRRHIFAVPSEGFDADGEFEGYEDQDIPDDLHRVFHFYRRSILGEKARRRAGAWDFKRSPVKGGRPQIWITCPRKSCKSIMDISNRYIDETGSNARIETGVHPCVLCDQCLLHLWFWLRGYEKYLEPQQDQEKEED